MRLKPRADKLLSLEARLKQVFIYFISYFCYKPANSRQSTALLNAATGSKYNYNEIRTKTKITKAYPFSSLKKSMATAVEVNGNFILHVKGASEVILARCDKFLNGEGKSEDISPALREVITNTSSYFV